MQWRRQNVSCEKNTKSFDMLTWARQRLQASYLLRLQATVFQSPLSWAFVLSCLQLQTILFISASRSVHQVFFNHPLFLSWGSMSKFVCWCQKLVCEACVQSSPIFFSWFHLLQEAGVFCAVVWCCWWCPACGSGGSCWWLVLYCWCLCSTPCLCSVQLDRFYTDSQIFSQVDISLEL